VQSEKNAYHISSNLATLFASFSKAFVMGAFLINQANISKTLCENRNQPKKHCEGKCYLKKQMTKDEKKGQIFSSVFNK
jgi:hypothetical protein